MNLDILQLFIQVPLVGIFVWYTLSNNREWRTYLKDRNGKLENTLTKMETRMDKNNKIILYHLMNNPKIENKEEIKKMLNDE